MARIWRLYGTLTPDQAVRFPHLAASASPVAACLVLAVIAAGLAMEFVAELVPGRPSQWLPAVPITLSWRDLIKIGSLSLILLASTIIVVLAVARSNAAKRKGYRDFGPTLTLSNAGLLLSPALLARVPPFSEIESTPYNNPNDPEALLRMLDDLAAQLDGKEKAPQSA